jgi:membrane protein YdbS with pleckstrin-like domain
MTALGILGSVLLGLVVNEFSDVSPWLGRWLVRWSARVRYGDVPRAEIRAEELEAVINDRPGKLFKLGTGLRFALSALVVRARRILAQDRAETGERGEGESPLGRFLDVEPSTVVARYLFPTERFRGEWIRHWIHPAKSLGMIALYTGVGIWGTVVRVKPQYRIWVIVAILVLALALAAYRLLDWYYTRFIITNKRLMMNEGLWFRRVGMIPLARVTDLRYVQSPLGRLLDYGVFSLDSAGRRNRLRHVVDLPNPNELYLRVVEEMYEPTAVEARLARFADEWTSRAGQSPQAEPEPQSASPRAVLDEREHLAFTVATLAAHLDALTVALTRLTGQPQTASAEREPAPHPRRSPEADPSSVGPPARTAPATD